jgi:hypothetical protein
MLWLLKVVTHHKEIKIQYDKFHGNIKFIFYFKICIFHHPLIVVLIGENINLDMFFDNNMLNKYE